MKRVLGVMALIVAVLFGFRAVTDESSRAGTFVARPDSCAGAIALTFDDGPHRELTPVLLDVLRERGITATFFLTGERIAGNEDLVQRMVAEGHSVQNHTWSHPHLTELSDEEIVQQLEQTNAAIVAAGAPEPLFVRPPYGNYDERVREIIAGMGMTSVTWTAALDPKDWEGITDSELVERVSSNLQPAGVVLLHDIQAHSVAAMPAILDAVHQSTYCVDPYRGEEFWTLDV